jgi:hypothetical protein
MIMPHTQPNPDQPGSYRDVQVKVVGFCGVKCVVIDTGSAKYSATYTDRLSKAAGTTNIKVSNGQLQIIGDIK